MGLSRLRLAVCGAERLHDETRQLAKRRFDLELREGYGGHPKARPCLRNPTGATTPGNGGQFHGRIESRIER